MRFRRKKKLIIKICIFLLIIGIIFAFFIFIYPESNIPTYNGTNTNNENQIQIVTINSPNVNVTLPSQIKTIDLPSNSVNSNPSSPEPSATISDSNKTYESYIDESLSYLITILSADNTLTVLLSERSSTLIPSGSPTQIGVDYSVTGIAEKIIAVYDFTVDSYSYPIILLLSETGKVYYIDTESAYKSGEFKVSGQISGIPEIKNIYTVTVDGNYKSAVLVDNNDVGYEFNLNMIGK